MGTQFREVYAELGAEHTALMALIERLQTHRTLVGLVPMLESLHALLVNHFAHEQFPGGFYECMGAYGSKYDAELKILVNEHCVILSAVSGLLERARVAESVQTPDVLDELERLIQTLNAHEHKEHALAEKLLSSERDQATAG